MADHINQELKSMRQLVVKLANELDYKNHLLMEKEGLSLERFATRSSLIEEKDRLLGERSAVIGSLMAQKHRLNEVFIKEKQKYDHLKQEMKNLRRELEVQQQKSDTRTMEQEELLALKGKGPWTMTTNSTIANGCLAVPENQLSPYFDKHDKLQNFLEKEVAEDKKLAELREELGDEAYKAVIALLDFRKYNSSMKSSIPELWNFEEGRRAYMKEVIQVIIQCWEVHRNKDNEKSEAIAELMMEKEILLRKLTCINILMKEKDKLLKEKYAAIGKSTEQDMEKDKLIDKMSATISTLTEEKHFLLESCNAEKRTTQCMKEQIGKLKHKLQYREELAMQTEEHMESKHNNCGGYKSLAIKEESMDWYQNYLIKSVEPVTKKLKESEVHNSKRHISSASENTELRGQNTEEILKLPKAEPEMFGELSDGKWDGLGMLQPSTQLYLLPSKAVVPNPSHSEEKILEVDYVKIEDDVWREGHAACI